MTILCSTIIPWERDNIQVCEMFAAGTSAMHTTLDGAAAADKGSGEVRIPCTGHGFKVSSRIGIRGSTAYNGTFIISDADPESDSNYFNIYASFTAETFGGSETLRPEIEPEQFFRLLEIRLHLSDTGKTTGDTFAVTLDSGHPAGEYHDITVDSQDMNGITQDIMEFTDKFKVFNNNDMLYFNFTNGNSRNWGLEAKYAVLST